MGSGISTNYDQITPLFTIGYWNIHSAVKKITNEHVTLWVIDQDRLKNQKKKKKKKMLLLNQVKRVVEVHQ